MRRAFSIYFAFVFFLLLTSFAGGSDVSISVSTDAERIGLGESLNFKISVKIKGTEESSSPEFKAPDFKIVGRSSSTKIVTSFVNGKFTPKREDIYTYTLVAKKLGELLISQINVKVGEDFYRAEAQRILVEKDPVYSRPPSVGSSSHSSPRGKGARTFKPKQSKGDVFYIFANLDKKKAYLGDAIVVEYKLRSRKNINQIHITKWPSFDGFWKEDLFIPNRYSFQRKVIGNEIWLEAILARFVIYPLKVGNMEVDSIAMEGTFLMEEQDPFAANLYSFFGFQGLQKAVAKSKKDFVEVLALPELGKPSSFFGAVGKFNISLKAQKNKSKTDEALSFDFIVDGLGNFQSIEKPAIKFPSSFEIYESNSETKSKGKRGRAALEKQKKFSTIVLPRSPGNYSIAPVEWSYFDVSEKKYKTLRTAPIQINVEKGLSSSKTLVLAKPKEEEAVEAKDSFSVAKDNLRYLKLKREILEKETWNLNYLLKSINKFLLLLIAFLLLHILYKGLKPYFKKLKKGKKEDLNLSIKKLKTILAEKKPNYGELEFTLSLIQKIFLEEEVQGITQKEIKHMWKERHLSETFLRAILEAKELCDSKQYSSHSTEEERESFFRSVRKVLKLVQEQ